MAYELRVFFCNDQEHTASEVKRIIEMLDSVASVEMVYRKTTPVARRTDPATSHEAASADDLTGQRKLVYAYVGRTAKTCSMIAFEIGGGIRGSDVARRMVELQRLGLVRTVGTHVGYNGRRARTWVRT